MQHILKNVKLLIHVENDFIKENLSHYVMTDDCLISKCCVIVNLPAMRLSE